MSSFADMNAQIDSDTGIVSVSGSYEEMANKRVSVQIMAPGAKLDDIFLLGEKKFDEIFLNVFEVDSDKNGNFKLPEFRLASSGSYSARVTYAGASQEPLYIKNLCRYFSVQDKALVEGYLETSDCDSLFAFVDNYSDLFFTNDQLYKECDDNVRRNLVVLALEEFDNDSYEMFIQNLSRVCSVYFATQSSRDAYANFMVFFDDACFEQGYTPLANYSQYISEKNMGEIIQKFCIENSAEESAQTLKKVCDEIILTGVKNVLNHSFVEKILTDNETYLDIDIGDYKKLKDKRSVNKGLIELNAKNTDEFVEEFCELVKKAKKTNDKSSSGSTASQSGSSVSVNLPPTTNSSSNSQSEIDALKANFVDMADYMWAKEAVYALFEKGVISGVSSDRFAPSKLVTREEFIKMFIGAIYGDVSDSKEVFVDVPAGSWYEKYVASAYNKNIINGVSDNVFGVGLNITRQDIATIIYRANPQLFNIDSNSSETADADLVSDYAKISVNSLLAKGIITGYLDGSFKPLSYATRAETAVIIYRYLALVERG